MAGQKQTPMDYRNPGPIVVKPAPPVNEAGPFGGRAIDKGERPEGPAYDNALHHHNPGVGAATLDTIPGDAGETHQHIPAKVNHGDATTYVTDNHLLLKVNIEPDNGVPMPEDFLSVGSVRYCYREPKVRDLA